MLNQNQIQKLVNIVDKYNILFVGKHVGIDVLSNNDKAILKNNGIDLKKFPKISTVEKAFKWGMLADAIGSARSKIMSYAQFQKYLKEGKFLPLTEREKVALNNVKLRSYSDIRGLGNRISKATGDTLIEADRNQRARLEKLIKKEAIEAVLDRKSVKEFASILASKTGDFLRDWERTAAYVMHSAFTEGKIEHIKKTYGSQAWVYFEVLKDACPHCRGLYLNPDGSPKKFLLSYVLKNGNNFGRKAAQWRVVSPPLHINCRCEIYPVPVNAEWDSKKKQFVEKKYVSPVGRTSHAKVIIS